MSSIFVQISSYHDHELGPTIYNLLEKSSHKHQINVGVHYIYHEVDNVKIPDLPNVKVIKSKAPDNLGMGLGRLIAHGFYNDEDYYLQIDSHSRFDDNWDEKAINSIKEYQALGFKKPLITQYPKNYWHDGVNIMHDKNNNRSKISFKETGDWFKNMRIVKNTAIILAEDQKEIFTKSVSGGSIFTVGGFIQPNPKIVATGEEIFIAARAYTNGYDLLIPHEDFMYHLYYSYDKPLINNRRLIWNDYTDLIDKMEISSKKEIFDIFTSKVVGPFELGLERTLDQFGVYAHLDFKNGELLEEC